MSTIFMTDCSNGAMNIKRSIMEKVNMHEMKMAMVSTRYTVIHKKGCDSPPMRSLLRSWLRPHRGVSQEKLPFYVGFFEWAARAVGT